MRGAILVAVAMSCLMLDKAAGAAGPQYYVTGNKLLEFCEVPAVTSACYGYVLGVVDALQVMGADAPKFSFCVPERVESGQLVDVVKAFLRDHPEKRHLPASDLVTAALNEKFPCN
jgi:Rap1a immunity proteins